MIIGGNILKCINCGKEIEKGRLEKIDTELCFSCGFDHGIPIRTFQNYIATNIQTKKILMGSFKKLSFLDKRIWMLKPDRDSP